MKKPYGLTMRGLAKNKDKILILKRHPKSTTNPNKWELPGGKVDPGECFDVALIREFDEETKLSIKLGDLIGAIQEDFPHKRTVAIIMEVDINKKHLKETNPPEIIISDEHIDYKWAKIEEIKNLELSGWFKQLLIEKNYKI